jgi:DNA modification methylase
VSDRAESGRAINHWTQDIHQGDAVETLAEMPESSVHMAMCSPPYYGLRDYDVDGQIGLEDSLDEYIQELLDVAEELRRVLRDDGSWWLNLGDTFAGSRAAQGFAGECKEYTDETPEKSPHRNSSLRRKSKMLVPHRVAIALEDAGWLVRADCPWVKPNPMPHPVKDRLHEHKEFVFHLTPEPDYWFDLDAVREPHKEASLERDRHNYSTAGVGMAHAPREDDPEHVLMDAEDALHENGKNPGDIFEVSVRAFPDAHFAVYPPELVETPLKASCPPKVCAECGAPYEREREVVDREVGGGSPAVPDNGTGYQDQSGNHQGDYGDRDGYTQPTDVELGDWTQVCDCETDATEPGIALDPFAGAGTTALVAKELGRRFVGIDLNPEYVAMAQKRVGLTVDEPERFLEDDETSLAAYADGGATRDGE